VTYFLRLAIRRTTPLLAILLRTVSLLYMCMHVPDFALRVVWGFPLCCVVIPVVRFGSERPAGQRPAGTAVFSVVCSSLGETWVHHVLSRTRLLLIAAWRHDGAPASVPAGPWSAVPCEYNV